MHNYVCKQTYTVRYVMCLRVILNIASAGRYVYCNATVIICGISADASDDSTTYRLFY